MVWLQQTPTAERQQQTRAKRGGAIWLLSLPRRPRRKPVERLLCRARGRPLLLLAAEGMCRRTRGRTKSHVKRDKITWRQIRCSVQVNPATRGADGRSLSAAITAQHSSSTLLDRRLTFVPCCPLLPPLLAAVALARQLTTDGAEKASSTARSGGLCRDSRALELERIAFSAPQGKES